MAKIKLTQVLVQTQIELWSDPIERTPLCSQTEITGSGKRFERTIVWTMVWFRSDQRSIRSGRSDHSLYSLDHGLGSVWSEVNWVLKFWFRVHFFFQFFCFLLRLCQELALPRGNNKAAFRSETHLKSDDSDWKQRVHCNCRSPQEEIFINWRPRRFLWKAV